MSETISTTRMLARLNKLVGEYDTIKEAAEDFKVSPQFMGAVISGSKLPSKKILARLKLKPVKDISYRYKVLGGDK